MSAANKKAYVFKMNMGPANVLSLFILIVTYIIGSLLFKENLYGDYNCFVLIILILLYFGIHELLHGVGYYIGGCKLKNIQFGVCLEKGICYAMAYQELSKKNILISLQMPFMVIGVITFTISVIFHLPLLAFLSITNFSGASMDLMMFFYLLRIKNVTYSESGNPDEFVLITDENLKNKKSIFFKIVDVKDYKKEDYVFNIDKKIVISKLSYIVIGILLLIGLVSLF